MITQCHGVTIKMPLILGSNSVFHPQINHKTDHQYNYFGIVYAFYFLDNQRFLLLSCVHRDQLEGVLRQIGVPSHIRLFRYSVVYRVQEAGTLP